MIVTEEQIRDEVLDAIKQHRRVYAVFGADIGGPIHALSLVTKAE